MVGGEEKRMRLMKRDIEILKFINACGYCLMPQIEKRFSLKHPLGYRLVKRLLHADLVRYKQMHHGAYGMYFLSPIGAQYTGLPPLDKISVANYEHQMALTDVYIRLLQRYPVASLITERHLKHDKFYDGVGKSGHVSDGLLVFPDQKQVAIEVELHLKGKPRLERIMRNYALQFVIKEVWYFCPPNLITALSSILEKMPFIKIHNLSEFLL